MGEKQNLVWDGVVGYYSTGHVCIKIYSIYDEKKEMHNIMFDELGKGMTKYNR